MATSRSTLFHPIQGGEMRGCKKSVYSLGWGADTYRKYPH
jgi:hypothetical protein